MRVSSLAFLMFLVACSNPDVTFGLKLVGAGVGGIIAAPTLPVSTIAVLEVQLASQQDMDVSQESICVDLTTITGRLTCPGDSCTTLALADAGPLDSRRIFLQMPVGAFADKTFPVYKSTSYPGNDVITGNAYKASCAQVTTLGAPSSGANYLEIEIGPEPQDMGAKSD
jgi:hypothetical protein